MDIRASDAPAPGAIEEDLALLLSAVDAAGDLAMSYFGRGLEGKKKADNSPVSEADLAVDRLLRDWLTGARPGYGWLSEETADRPDRLSASRVWIVDPIDGTRAFLAGTTDWTISVALVEEGEPVLGAILNPAKSDFFTVRRGQGAFLNGQPIAVSVGEETDNSRIIATKGFLKSLPCRSGETPPAHSAAYRVALVAAGVVDATVSLSGKSEWDLAAGALLVQEAGGRVTDVKGAALRFNQPNTRIAGLVAANPALHKFLISRTRELASGQT